MGCALPGSRSHVHDFSGVLHAQQPRKRKSKKRRSGRVISSHSHSPSPSSGSRSQGQRPRPPPKPVRRAQRGCTSDSSRSKSPQSTIPCGTWRATLNAPQSQSTKAATPSTCESEASSLPSVVNTQSQGTLRGVTEPCTARVVYSGGVTVQMRWRTDSKTLCSIPRGTALVVEEVVGTRARISKPVEGWVSLSLRGSVLVAETDNNTPMTPIVAPSIELQSDCSGRLGLSTQLGRSMKDSTLLGRSMGIASQGFARTAAESQATTFDDSGLPQLCAFSRLSDQSDASSNSFSSDRQRKMRRSNRSRRSSRVPANDDSFSFRPGDSRDKAARVSPCSSGRPSTTPPRSVLRERSLARSGRGPGAVTFCVPDLEGRLPPKALLVVVSWLPPEAAVNMPSVCRSWRSCLLGPDASGAANIWRRHLELVLLANGIQQSAAEAKVWHGAQSLHARLLQIVHARRDSTGSD